MDDWVYRRQSCTGCSKFNNILKHDINKNKLTKLRIEWRNDQTKNYSKSCYSTSRERRAITNPQNIQVP